MNKIRLVLADDHIVVRRGLCSLLKPEPDIEVVGEASDGQSAVKLTREFRPDVVLMDYSMPVMDGLQATKIIHSEFPQICVIGLSMYQEAERAAAMRKAGASRYLTKASPPESLLSAIRDCMHCAN